MSVADHVSLVDYPAWRAQGACAGKPIEWWYPGRGESNADAVAVCAGCPVLVECRQWGIEHENNGVWGGLSERERRRVRRRLGIVCHVPEETPPR